MWRVVWLVLAALLVGLGGAALVPPLLFPSRPEPRLAPQNGAKKPVPPTRESAPLPPSDLWTRVNLTSAWAHIPVPNDPRRPYISLQANGPFRLRSAGRLYVIAAGTPVAVDLVGQSFIDVRAVSAPVELVIVIVSSARSGGSK